MDESVLEKPGGCVRARLGGLKRSLLGCAKHHFSGWPENFSCHRTNRLVCSELPRSTLLSFPHARGWAIAMKAGSALLLLASLAWGAVLLFLQSEHLAEA